MDRVRSAALLSLAPFVLFFVAAILPTKALALDGKSPGDIVITTVENVRQLIKKEKATLNEEQLDTKIREVISPLFNFAEMSRRCLGPNWKEGTPEQQQEFVTHFSDLLARTYISRIRKGLEESEVKLADQKIEGEKAIARTVVTDSKGDVLVDYRLMPIEGRWQVYDVIIENVGLVSTYRTEFSGIVRNEKFAGLLERLRSKQVKVKSLAPDPQ